MGESAGGHLAALLDTTGDVASLDVGDHLDRSSRVNGVIDFYGNVDLVADASANPAIGTVKSPHSQLLGGPVLERRNFARQANPVACCLTRFARPACRSRSTPSRAEGTATLPNRECDGA